MKKKEYISPEICVVLMEAQTMLSGSKAINVMSDPDDYDDEAMVNYWDNDKGIWAD